MVYGASEILVFKVFDIHSSECHYSLSSDVTVIGLDLFLDVRCIISI